ncbi:MAG: hypothetical protein HYX74_09540 [Acidobacteria bacterium]|nr:hypothetical protein [Acidobacteriota bacterium]
MKRPAIWMFLWTLGLMAAALQAVSPETLLRELLLDKGLPAKIKRDRSKVARWYQIDQIVNDVLVPRAERLPAAIKAALPNEFASLTPSAERAQLRKLLARSEILFADLFEIEEDQFFPLTNSVLKLAPEPSLEGMTVFDRSGRALGTFAGKSRYERGGGLYGSRGYTLVTFQYQTPKGELRYAGNDNLLDRFLVRWSDIRSRNALDLGFLVAP